MLVGATLPTLAWANSPVSAGYTQLLANEISVQVGGSTLSIDLAHWINDALMAEFFNVIGLESGVSFRSAS